MPTAAEYARVFRAAADGIAEGVLPRARYDNAEYVDWFVDKRRAYDECVQRIMTPYPGNGISAEYQGHPELLAPWLSYRGIATMFEKMAAAEGGA